MKIAKCWWEEQWRSHVPNWNHCHKSVATNSELKESWNHVGYWFYTRRRSFTRVSPKQLCKYWEKHVSAAGFFRTNWKLSNNWCRSFSPVVLTEKITKISKKEVYKLFKSTDFASYRIFLVQITTICFWKVQYMYISAWIALEYRGWS